MKVQNIMELAKTMNILYVEDEADIRTQMSSTFEIMFHTVFVGTNGREGLELYQAHGNEIDFIITDLQMPELNGIEMLRHVKAIDPGLHAIIITAHNDLQHFSDAIEVGVEGFIIKPVQQEQLLKALYKCVKNRLMEIENERYQANLEELVEEKTKEIEKLYNQDRLTGCYNREKLENDLHVSEPPNIALVNIDNFDAVNSTYGYHIGDELLKQFSDFIGQELPETFRLYRIGGDEFVFMCVEGQKEKVEEIVIRIIETIREHTFIIDEITLHVTCTIGISDDRRNGLIKAHAALKEIREIGKNRFHFYSEESSFIKKQKSNIEWMRKVKEALVQETISPFFQPIIDNQTGKIVKYECLARMQEAQRIIAPYYFIEPARLVGLLPKITEVMMEKSFQYFSDKQESVEFSINITENDLKEGFVITLLSRLSSTYGIAPHRVTLEILENISAQGSEEALEQLIKLKTMGFQLALDDFGSDKSNFYRLQKMNVDLIKIDGSFIKDIEQNENSRNITKTIVNLAESLGCKVVAEFVHNEAVFQTVKALGIHYSQGYYFGEPASEIILP